MLIQEHFAKARGEKKHPGSSGKELLISELFDSLCLTQTFSSLFLTSFALKSFSNLTKALTCKSGATQQRPFPLPHLASAGPEETVAHL